MARSGHSNDSNFRTIFVYRSGATYQPRPIIGSIASRPALRDNFPFHRGEDDVRFSARLDAFDRGRRTPCDLVHYRTT
jgi:hypothetical protein